MNLATTVRPIAVSLPRKTTPSRSRVVPFARLFGFRNHYPELALHPAA